MIGIRDLPFPKFKKKNNIKKYVIQDDLCLEQWIIPKGTEVTLTTTTNFGIVIINKNQLDKSGFIIPRRIFKY